MSGFRVAATPSCGSGRAAAAPADGRHLQGRGVLRAECRPDRFVDAVALASLDGGGRDDG
jgi:uncharacterized protein YbbK (DUF523 family)